MIEEEFVMWSQYKYIIIEKICCFKTMISKDLDCHCCIWLENINSKCFSKSIQNNCFASYAVKKGSNREVLSLTFFFPKICFYNLIFLRWVIVIENKAAHLVFMTQKYINQKLFLNKERLFVFTQLLVFFIFGIKETGIHHRVSKIIIWSDILIT